jgi:hypothetical protein
MSAEHVIRPPSESVLPAAEVLGIPHCLHLLESAVRDALIHLWEEPYRKRAHALARSITGGCSVCGFKESSGLLRSLESLLSLTVEDTSGIQRSVAERILEILALLKDQGAKLPPAAPHAAGETVG